MEHDITFDEAFAIIAVPEFDGYGTKRLYGVIEGGECHGQITGIKSTYQLMQYDYSRIYYKTNDGTVPIRRA